MISQSDESSILKGYLASDPSDPASDSRGRLGNKKLSDRAKGCKTLFLHACMPFPGRLACIHAHPLIKVCIDTTPCESYEENVCTVVDIGMLGGSVCIA